MERRHKMQGGAVNLCLAVAGTIGVAACDRARGHSAGWEARVPLVEFERIEHG